jgi:hypothetical protein
LEALLVGLLTQLAVMGIQELVRRLSGTAAAPAALT